MTYVTSAPIFLETSYIHLSGINSSLCFYIMSLKNIVTIVDQRIFECLLLSNHRKKIMKSHLSNTNRGKFFFRQIELQSSECKIYYHFANQT